METILFFVAFAAFVGYIGSDADNKRVMRRVGGLLAAIALVIYAFVSANNGYHDPDADHSCNPVVYHC